MIELSLVDGVKTAPGTAGGKAPLLMRLAGVILVVVFSGTLKVIFLLLLSYSEFGLSVHWLFHHYHINPCLFL